MNLKNVKTKKKVFNFDLVLSRYLFAQAIRKRSKVSGKTCETCTEASISSQETMSSIKICMERKTLIITKANRHISNTIEGSISYSDVTGKRLKMSND